MGSPIFADQIPAEDELMIARLRAAGCVTVGKTNTPEFGAGSHTFNTVFGVTRNPHDLSRSSGGSSGGAAAALAAGMVPLADGSDLGGSLRNPASFCGVIGFRPTPGTVPSWPTSDPLDPLPTEGPMGRCAADVALLLNVIAGPHPLGPMRGTDGPFEPLERSLTGLRVAFDPTAGGLPVAAEVQARARRSARTVHAARVRWSRMTSPICAARERCSRRFGRSGSSATSGPLYDAHFDELKDTIRWNVELARSLTAADVGRAVRERAVLQARVRQFFDRFDIFALPTVQVAPFPVEVDWVRDIEGTPMANYLQWMRSCTDISVTGCPAISVPAGFTPDGLPVGLQLVGPPGADLLLLQIAHAFDGDGSIVRRWPRDTSPDPSP